MENIICIHLKNMSALPSGAALQRPALQRPVGLGCSLAHKGLHLGFPVVPLVGPLVGTVGNSLVSSPHSF